MAINVKKYTKDQMAKMVENAQAEVTALEVEITALENCIDEKNDLIAEYANLKAAMQRKNVALTERLDQMNGEAINKANEIAIRKRTRMRRGTSSPILRRRWEGQMHFVSSCNRILHSHRRSVTMQRSAPITQKPTRGATCGATGGRCSKESSKWHKERQGKRPASLRQYGFFQFCPPL